MAEVGDASGLFHSLTKRWVEKDTYNRKNLLDLISVFTAPLLFAVLHGRHELGSVDEATFLGRRDDGPQILLLAGRAWRVKLLDWKRRRAHAEPAEDAGRSRWRGGGQLLGHDLCRAIGRVLADDAAAPAWSRRAVARMESVRSEYPWLPGDGSNVLLAAGEEAAWWTFAGGRANVTLAHAMATRLDANVTSDNFAVQFPPGLGADVIGPALDGLRGSDPGRLVVPAGERAIEGLKFAGGLPPNLAARAVEARLADARVCQGDAGPVEAGGRRGPIPGPAGQQKRGQGRPPSNGSAQLPVTAPICRWVHARMTISSGRDRERPHGRPPARIRACRITAYGSYLGCLA